MFDPGRDKFVSGLDIVMWVDPSAGMPFSVVSGHEMYLYIILDGMAEDTVKLDISCGHSQVKLKFKRYENL